MIDVGVAPGTDLGVARAALHEAALAVIATPPFVDEVLEPPEVLGVQSLAPEGITLRLRVKTLAGRQFQLERAIRESVEQAFRRHGVEPAIPTMTIRLHPPNGRVRPGRSAARGDGRAR